LVKNRNYEAPHFVYLSIPLSITLSCTKIFFS
jgi:hypothetical protein